MVRPTDSELAEWDRGIGRTLGELARARMREMFDALASERDRADKAEAWMRQVADGLGYSECGSETGGVWVCATADEVVAGLSVLVGTLAEESTSAGGSVVLVQQYAKGLRAFGGLVAATTVAAALDELVSS